MNSPIDQTAPNGTRWMLLAGVWLIYSVFGMLMTSVAPLIAPISADLDIGTAQMGLILGLWSLTYIGAALPAGVLLDRIGARPGLLLAALIIAASGVLRGLALGPVSFALAIALFGLGGPLISVGAPKLIGEMFTGRDRGTAMGIYVTGPYLGSVITLATTNSVLLPLGGGEWRNVMLMLGGLGGLAGLVWLAVTAPTAARRLLATAQGGGRFDPVAFRTIIGAVEVRLVLGLAISIFMVNHGLNNWLPALIAAHGVDATTAGYWAAVPTATGIVGALTIPRLATAQRQSLIMALLVGCVLVASFLLRQPPGPVLAVGLILQGMARGTMMTIAMLLLMDCRSVPRDRLGMAGGVFFTVAEIGGVLGPALFGALAEASGGFGLPLLGLGVLCLVMLALIGLLQRQRGASAAAVDGQG